jgi:hypothetical protein
MRPWRDLPDAELDAGIDRACDALRGIADAIAETKKFPREDRLVALVAVDACLGAIGGVMEREP